MHCEHIIFSLASRERGPSLTILYPVPLQIGQVIAPNGLSSSSLFLDRPEGSAGFLVSLGGTLFLDLMGKVLTLVISESASFPLYSHLVHFASFPI